MHELYFYSEPNLLYINSDDIIDLDLENIDGKNQFKIIYKDNFFHFNFKNSRKKIWSVIIQSYDEFGNFLLQSNFTGKTIKNTKNNKGEVILKINYDQITNNRAWSSIPPLFEKSKRDYLGKKITYLRDLKIKELTTF